MVKENEAPIISLDTQYSICNDESAIVEASLESHEYQWRRGDVTLEEISGVLMTDEPGVYTVRATNEQGCTSIAEFEVLAKESPELTIAEVYEICPGEAAILEVSGAAESYTWTFEDVPIDGADLNTLEALEEGSYAVTGRSASGCIAMASTEVVFGPSPQITLEDQIEICPRESIILDPGDHQEYAWSNGETTREIMLTSPDPDEDNKRDHVDFSRPR